jgi:hypothetical protein
VAVPSLPMVSFQSRTTRTSSAWRAFFRRTHSATMMANVADCRSGRVLK